jgi:hypothetical protein
VADSNALDDAVAPLTVRYIKLGRGGDWEAECLRDGIIRFGTGSAQPDRYAAAIAGRWDDLKQLFLADGKSMSTSTRATNETRWFFTATPSTMWITFSGQRLWWGFAKPEPPQPHEDGSGTFRRVAGGWRNSDLADADLTMERLAGSLTKAALYRGTSFELTPRNKAYVVDRINGRRSPQVVRALAAEQELRDSAIALINLLDPKDFELLVDLVFTSSGWRRISDLGNTMKTVDLVVELPSTGEQAWIQIKSATTKDELDEYVALLDDLPYARLFFVYHTGHLSREVSERVVVIGPEKLAGLVVDAGLVGWLIGKVS